MGRARSVTPRQQPTMSAEEREAIWKAGAREPSKDFQSG